jgi:hypothetical protein
MKCKRVKELLLTDYIDDKERASLNEDFKQHLSSCQDCGNYKAALDKGLLPLFLESKIIPPEDEIWEHIKSHITQDRQRPKADIFALGNIFRRNAFAFATAAVLLLMVISYKVMDSRKSEYMDNFISEGGYSLYSLNNDNGQEAFRQPDFNTIIEEYFM